ncbi:MAG: alpha/beta fold hydrolase [Acidimicrobiia bacterium]
MRLNVRLLGEFAVEVDERSVPTSAWNRRNAALLVKLLSLAPGRRMHREQVLDALWPDVSPEAATTRLHKAAHFARRAADTDVVVLRQDLAALAPEADVTVDVERFELLADTALRAGDPQAIEEALAAYGGQLLPHDLYEDWTIHHRQRLDLKHRALLRAGERWAELLALEPTDEEAYLGLMREDLRRGDRTAVLRAFDELNRVLADELGIGPSPEAVGMRTLALAGGEASTDDTPAPPAAPLAPRHAGLGTQTIRFVRGRDGVRIAYATSGSGPPLVKTPNWLTHLDYDWESPVWRGWWQALSLRYELIRFDQRGCGMSAWDAEDISLEASVRDLETVVDALDLDRFPLLGISRGGPIAIVYADRHPERVSRLILYGTYAVGQDTKAETEEQRTANRNLLTSMQIGWGTDDPAFRLVYAHRFMPEGPLEQWKAFTELQRHTASPENAVRLRMEYGQVDVREHAARLQVPTLIIHARDEILRPFDDALQLSELIVNSELVPLPSCNHILQTDEPAFSTLLQEIDRFIGR